MYQIKKEVAEKVLMIGPDYKDHKGGIGAVIALQKDAFGVFNFIPTYRPFNSNLTKSFFFVKQTFAITRFLMKNPVVEIIHMHTSQDGSFFRKLAILFICKTFFKKKVINHTNASNFHTFYENGNGLVKKTIKYYLNTCDATLTVSESWKKFYIDTFNLPRVYKIYNLSEQKCFGDTIRNLQDNDRVNFLFLGRLGDRKGIFDLLQAISANKEKLSGKMTLTVGGDGEVDRFNQTIEEKKLNGIVKYVGWISGEQKDELLKATDVFILPSYNEGMPLSILEAMGYGKPIISTPVAGIPEIVFHKRNGIMVTPGDTKAIYESLQHYIDYKADVSNHGKQSLEIIKDFYADAVMPQLEDIYTSLLN